MKKPLPVGVDDFEKLIRNGYCYVDKTLFIKELLDKKGDVNLFTRPRRFGKTLNLSMLKYFFEDTGNSEKNAERAGLFDGLSIMGCGEKYTECMNRYPVISLSLKSAKQPDFQQAYYALMESISGEYKRHLPLMEKMELNPEDEQRYSRMTRMKASREECNSSLYFLSACLNHACGGKTIILIDEYDVPLENAYFSGFYDEMIAFIRSLFESALKSNPFLEFGVITGCLRITKESIFTGLNNLKIVSILSNMYGEYFGFTQEETNSLLLEYEKTDARDIVKSWYDGYCFGQTKVYNPWSLICFLDAETAMPAPYWANTSSNDIIKSLVEQADMTVRTEMEKLISGGKIEKQVHEEITYDGIYDSEESLWNFLFFTGYLRMESLRMEGRNRYITMAIPNEEVACIYENTIKGWFRDQIRKKDLTILYQAMLDGNEKIFQEQLSALLLQTISYMDGQENFYHGFLLGILGNLKDYSITSNRESGNGRYDIMVQSPDIRQMPVILELKISKSYDGLEKACENAIRQIESMKYGNALSLEGYKGIVCYGIGFFKKQCLIRKKIKLFQ